MKGGVIISDSINFSIPLSSLFTDKFMAEYTNCITFDEFLNNGNYLMNSEEDLRKIDPFEFDQYISDNTQFNSWTEMYTASGNYFFNSLK